MHPIQLIIRVLAVLMIVSLLAGTNTTLVRLHVPVATDKTDVAVENGAEENHIQS